MKSTGRFIVIEGLDGAGTSTQVKMLSKHLRGIGLSVHTTKEPSNGPIGRQLRDAVEGRVSLTVEALALGFAADRLDHMNPVNGVERRLADGTWVVSDRYVLSSLAYQAAQGVDFDWLVEINRHAREPDVTVFVDTPIETCLKRIRARNANAEDLFHRRTALRSVGDAYVRALALGRFAGVLTTADGRLPIDDVFAQTCDGIGEALANDLGLFSAAPVSSVPPRKHDVNSVSARLLKEVGAPSQAGSLQSKA